MTRNSFPGQPLTAWQFDLTIVPGQRTDNPYVQSWSSVITIPSNQAYFTEMWPGTRTSRSATASSGAAATARGRSRCRSPTTSTSSFIYTVRADAAIGINFNSNGAGSVTVNSNNAVTVAGAIDNATGTSSITAPRIYQGTNGVVGGKNITLSTSDGIGTDSSAVAVALNGGNLTASSTYGSIYIAATGGLKLNTVTAAGNVKLTATNDIVSAGAMNLNGTPTITGRNITLTTTGGAIGASTVLVNNNPAPANIQPLVLQAGGVVNASGTTAVYLAQKNGDFRVGKVESNGAVFLMAAGVNGQPANLLNGVVTTPDPDAQARAAQVWADLNLDQQ